VIAALAMTGVLLLDQRSTPFSLAEFRGHTVAVTFVSAQCTDACPLIDAQIAQAALEARRRGSPMRFVTLTLDPQRDGVAQMRALARTFGADPRYWRLATGSVANVNSLMRAFGVQTQNDAHGYPQAHTTFVYILDARGRLVRTLMPSSHLSETLLEVARQ
jgi:protein SCO1